MEFPDNLKRIRKENNLSQEQFAEKLGVSRQAVSKWESGQSYPEMDKVLQICKLYNFNIDELLNQNVKQINEEIDSKINMNKYIEGFLSYISKTVNMFCAMKFGQKIKCLFEQFVIAIVLFIIFSIIGGIGGSILDNIISIFPYKAYGIIESILETIYLIIALVTGTTILVYLFKIRYLDYYKVVRREDKNEDNKKNTSDVGEEKETELLVDNSNKVNTLELPKSEKIIFRDPKDSQFKFVTAIAKVMIFCMKIFIGFIAFWAVLAFVGIVVATVLSFLISKSGALFIGILISLISSGIINYVILEVCYNFIVNRKVSKTRIGLMIIIPLVTLGIGIGVAVIGAYNINIIDSNDEKYEKQEVLEVDMENNLFIPNYSDIKYVEEDRDNVKVVVDYMNYIDVDIQYEEYSTRSYVYVSSYEGEGFIEHLKRLVGEINDKKITVYKEYQVTVYASKENIQKLRRNN